MFRSSGSRRTLVAAAAVAAAWLVPAALLGQPARAHGAMANPPSRAVACGPEGGAAAMSAACRAADAAGGGAAAFKDFDNIRVANVNGRDAQRIPDGKLCSGGLPAFKGLDLARADWPATTLTAGAKFTFRYRVTIPHTGSFRLYITKNSYQATRPLRWQDLEAKPFLTVANPQIQGGAYVMKGRLPAGRSGRQLIYTVWQTTSTPDTYYSCSDVVFGTRSAAPAAAGSSAAGSAAAGQAGTTDASPIHAAPVDAAQRPVAAVSHTNPTVPIAVSVGIGLAGAGAVLLIRRRRLDQSRVPARPDQDNPRFWPQA